MIDTEDLTSYYSGYDEYLELSNDLENLDSESEMADLYYEEKMIRRELIKMERKIINLNETNLTFDEMLKLENYIWKNDKLIPVEMIEGD